MPPPGTTGQELQSPCGTNADSRILYFFQLWLFYFCLLGAKRLAFNGAVDWVTGPLAPVLFIGPLLFFLAPFFTTSFHFSTFPEGRSTEQTNKRRFAGYDPHMNFFSRFPIDGLLFQILPAALAGTPPVRERKRGLDLPLFFSGQRERETKTFWTTRREKKKEGFLFFFSGWVKRDLFGQRENRGTTLGKAGKSVFLSRRCICSVFWFSFSFSPISLYFRARRPGMEKTHTNRHHSQQQGNG